MYGGVREDSLIMLSLMVIYTFVRNGLLWKRTEYVFLLKRIFILLNFFDMCGCLFLYEEGEKNIREKKSGGK